MFLKSVALAAAVVLTTAVWAHGDAGHGSKPAAAQRE